MTREELKNELLRIEREFIAAKKEALRKYALANATHKVGDIVSDDTCTILVQRIGFSTSIDGTAQARYIGIELKKDGTPKKNNIIGEIYQSRIINGNNRLENTSK